MDINYSHFSYEQKKMILEALEAKIAELEKQKQEAKAELTEMSDEEKFNKISKLAKEKGITYSDASTEFNAKLKLIKEI